MSELGELSNAPADHFISPKRGTGHEVELKESAGVTFNPKCPPSAFPNCMHGGTVNEKTCTCKCKWNHVGQKCETCNAKACKNGGKMDMKQCKCVCPTGHSGVDCAVGSKCLHGGKPNGGACTCANAWSGPTCGACKLNCNNGGKSNPADCTCICPAPFLKPMCDKCKDPGCRNGGKWDAATCKCDCDETLAFTGIACNKCTDPKCVHGKFNAAKCRCLCAHDGWRGTRCEKCGRVCTGGKVLDPKTCTCGDAKSVSYNPCKTGCKHGDLDSKSCKCKCDKDFKGIFCDECKNEKCYNNGEHDGNTCKCKCFKPWAGKDCKECTTKCVNGQLKNNCGGCQCALIPAGSWKGFLCDKCVHEPCKNGGTLDESTCTCKCVFGYSGPTCASCDLTQAICKNKSIFRPNTCDCECKDTVGDWSGRFCDKCNHQGCKNGGEVDKKLCLCKCVPMWKGRYCGTCGHKFCGAKKMKWLKGSEGFKSLDSKKECKWVSDLGCPGGMN